MLIATWVWTLSKGLHFNPPTTRFMFLMSIFTLFYLVYLLINYCSYIYFTTFVLTFMLAFLLEDIADFCIHTSQFVTLMWNAFRPSDLCTVFHYSDCMAVSCCCEFSLHYSAVLTQSTPQQKLHTNFCRIPPSTKKRQTFKPHN